MNIATKFLFLALALALPSTMNATGADGGERPHRKHSKSPDKHKKSKDKTPQDKALHDAKKAMDTAKKILDDAIRSEHHAQQEQARAQNHEQRYTQAAAQVTAKLAGTARRLLIEGGESSESGEAYARNHVRELQRIMDANKKTIDDSFEASNKLQKANKALADAQVAVGLAQANYNGARAYYETLLAQANAAKK